MAKIEFWPSWVQLGYLCLQISLCIQGIKSDVPLIALDHSVLPDKTLEDQCKSRQPFWSHCQNHPFWWHSTQSCSHSLNPTALRMDITQWSFRHSECNWVKFDFLKNMPSPFSERNGSHWRRFRLRHVNFSFQTKQIWQKSSDLENWHHRFPVAKVYVIPTLLFWRWSIFFNHFLSFLFSVSNSVS